MRRIRNISTQLEPALTRFLPALLLIFALGGCGVARIAFHQADFLTRVWLDRYLDFTSEQRRWAKPAIDDIFDWHRKAELPVWTGLLKSAQQRIHRQVTEAEVKADADQVRRRLLALVEHALPALADLALSLQPEQIAHLENKFHDNNEDYRKDYLDGDIEQRQRHRYRNALKRAEYFLGDLDREQQRRLRQLSDQRPLNNQLVLNARQRRQQELLALLRRISAERPPRDTVVELLRDYLARAQNHFGDPEHIAYYRSLEAGTIRQITEVLNGATPSQRKHFIEKLQYWIDDFERLAAR